jgi:hypothetical protein
VNDPGDLTYAEAVTAGLYGDGHVDAGGAVVTYGISGPAVPPHFGEGLHAPTVLPAQRS